MLEKRCFTRYTAGHYGYKNGITIKKVKSSQWEVYTVYMDKKNVLFTGRTLRSCLYWISNN